MRKGPVKLLCKIAKRTYEEKSKVLNLTTLVERHWRGDMIQTWKILNGKDRVNPNIWFDMEAERSREGATSTRNSTDHPALRPREYKYMERGFYFSNRVVEEYNSLPTEVKKAATINAFKNSLDKFRGTPSRSDSRTTATSHLTPTEKDQWGSS